MSDNFSKKRILILTQSVNKEDPILGFFHGWLLEFSKHFENIFVICLAKGEYDLPKNVKVFSLGKERGVSRFRKLLTFYSLLFTLRRQYDSVFVHMNQEYVLLGGCLWRLFKKKIYLWRNYHYGDFWTKIAVILCDKTFCTSRSSYIAQFKKNIIMPVGVNTRFFRQIENADRKPGSILSLGRIAPDKKLEVLIEALSILDKQGMAYRSSIYGDIFLEEHRGYAENLKASVEAKGLDKKIKFYSAVPNDKTPEIYNSHEIFVNLSPSGMYDKTIFEAAACGCLVLASSKDWENIADEKLFFDGSAVDLANKLSTLFKLTKEDRENLRTKCRHLAYNHSLEALGDRLATVIN